MATQILDVISGWFAGLLPIAGDDSFAAFAPIGVEDADEFGDSVDPALSPLEEFH